ncbi:unnamed protein product [Caenorhabditis bovis]|uniref:Potassium channel domain-containing protein n=1 Tax=Caenorhabditis bovis TaxID=2654633 RepID=A0A8S1E959_9PELO|nr:unnamed protein product [Caenorhabditis bovis]
MFWNLVAVNYERYHLHHIAKIVILLLYSLFGAYMFMVLEADNERNIKKSETTRILRSSIAAKQILIDKLQHLFFNLTTIEDYSETKLRKILADYDSSMGIVIDGNFDTKWDIWGGLYYSGTIYTTIGYGDLAATTIAGRIFTMLYAMVGIPMVITILNDWGNMLSYYSDEFWKKHGITWYYKFRALLKRRKKIGTIEEGAPLVERTLYDADDSKSVPLFLVVVILMFWVVLCVGYFAIFEEWTIFESVYFFFISMTTIGFGDITPKHSVAVGGIFFILGGLSVVSMSINVIQMKLELLFNKIVQDIENDFKNTLSVAAEESRKKSIGVSELGSIEGSKKKTMNNEGGDVAGKYSQSMDGANKFLMKFMSNHQKKMLNEKFDERARMRNSSTQTTSQIKVASVQTQERFEQQWDGEEEPEQPKSRINTRRLYIYNTGE